ncbi:MAG TPA: T9SS type A sorting domain-containing protein [bacterium (Candidatus Stahlbacteria)]|nr:T9SS type A sorting domain-containing protein [Candidatus Stahlbacteria bacterium]
MKQFYQYLSRFLIPLLLSTSVLVNVSSTYAGVATISIPDTSGMPGDTIIVPIRITNAAGLGVISADITLSFDPDILTADSASIGEAVPAEGLYLVKSNPTAGQIIIAVASAYPIGDGDLVTIPFIVSEDATPGDSCAIHFIKCKLNEDNVSSIAEDGLFVVISTYSISGHVRYYFNGAPIDSALASISLQVTKTDINGYYIFSNLSDRQQNYTVTLDRTNPTWDEAVSSYDASYVMHHVAGHINLDEVQQIAADVSGNGLISSYDAALILQYTAQAIEHFPVGDWTFTPESRNYSSLSGNLTNQDYYGILYGDVSGNWNNPNSTLKGGNINSNDKLSALLPATTTALVAVPNVTGVPDNSVTVPINISDASNIVAADIILTYNPNVLTPNDVSVTSFTSNYLIAYKVSDGQVRIALAGTNPLSGDGSLINITFDVSNTAYTSSSSPLTLARVELNEGNIPCKISSGTFTIVTAGIADNSLSTPDKFVLLGNSPNPFDQLTVIRYSIGSCEQLSTVSLRIFDLTGRLIRALVNESQKPGSYKVVWDGRDAAGRELPNGIYFCQLQATNYVNTKKIMLLR